MGIEGRIAEVLRRETQLIDVDANRVAAVLVAELGLTEFECDGEYWWSTKFYPLDDS